MVDRNSYESHQVFDSMRYDLSGLTEKMLWFLDNNAQGLDFLYDEEGRENFLYHKKGISIGLTLFEFTGELREICGDLSMVSIDMYSDITKTKNLENKIKKI